MILTTRYHLLKIFHCQNQKEANPNRYTFTTQDSAYLYLKIEDSDSGISGINSSEVTIQLVTLTLCPQMANKVFQQI